MARTGLRDYTGIAVLLVVGLIKWAVGLGGHSGESDLIEAHTEGREGREGGR